MLITFCSPGRAPGASTAALATALTWPAEVILAECDPAGGSALTGLCLNLLPADGIMQWALGVSRAADPATELTKQLLPLDATSHRRLLALPPGPAPLPALASCWELLATTMAISQTEAIVDIGRIGGTDTPAPLLERADHVLMVTRPDCPRRRGGHAGRRIRGGRH
jgi:hypothetical protein